MKYKSELIKDIVDTRGHEKSSLHYESECVEKWIEETEGAYPKLCDYESEWLNYINEKPIGNFPYETVTANPSATINNVVPYEYKSAILKGQTLANLLKVNKDNYSIGINSQNWHNEDGYLKCVSTTGWHTISDKLSSSTKPNTKYLIVVEIKENTLNIDIKFDTFGAMLNSISAFLSFNPNEVGTKKVILTTPSTIPTGKNGFFRIPLNIPNANSIFKFRVMAIEYQDGMENWDIPYFEGMKSVQVPVLTTRGKNLFDGIYERLGNKQFIRSTNYIKVKKGDNLIFSMSYSNGGYSVCTFLIYNNNKEMVGSKESSTIAIEQDGYIKFQVYTTQSEWDLSSINWIQIEKGSIATPYEPYQSNILTVNEDVTLRSNGSVCDELDLLTGKLTQRIGEDGEILTQEVIKTVDFSIQDQDGNILRKIKPIEGTMHITASGTPINPTASLEVPVEAITQNLSSFIEEE